MLSLRTVEFVFSQIKKLFQFKTVARICDISKINLFDFQDLMADQIVTIFRTLQIIPTHVLLQCISRLHSCVSLAFTTLTTQLNWTLKTIEDNLPL